MMHLKGAMRMSKTDKELAVEIVCSMIEKDKISIWTGSEGDTYADKVSSVLMRLHECLKKLDS